MTCKYTLAICLGVMLSAQSAHAHHAWAAVFTEETMDIEGYVTEYNFKNPHVNIMLSVTDEAGVETEWMATGPAASPFRSWGWTEDTIEVGQYLRLTGRTSRTGAPMIVLVADDIRNGNLLELDPADGSILRSVVGFINEDENEGRGSDPVASLPLTLSDGRVNLTGTWLSGPRGRRVPAPFNEVGAALQADFDAINDPAYATCSSPGLVRQVAGTPHPIRITQYDDRVVFEFEEHGGLREIFIDGRGPETAEHTRFGSHIARYEGDELIIETTQLLGNLANNGGNALTDQTTTIETYRRVDDPEMGPMFEMSMAISDPGHLTETWTVSWQKRFAPEGLDFVETDCKLPLPPSS
jgi:hypothetical protein